MSFLSKVYLFRIFGFLSFFLFGLNLFEERRRRKKKRNKKKNPWRKEKGKKRKEKKIIAW
jgi:hypothetical protein